MAHDAAISLIRKWAKARRALARENVKAGQIRLALENSDFAEFAFRIALMLESKGE